MSRYTVIRVTQYMSVYLSMKISDKVHTRIYWVDACMYFYSWFLVLIERAHTCTYSYVWAHTMCNCFVPACTLQARLHPAGLPAPCWPAWIWKQRISCSNKTHLVKNKYYDFGSYLTRQKLPPHRQQQNHWQHWQRPQAAQSSTATLFGQQICTWSLSQEVGLQG